MSFLNQIAVLIDFLEWWSIPVLFLLLAIPGYFRISIFSWVWKKSLRESFSNQAGRKSIMNRIEKYTGRNHFAQYKKIMNNGLAFFGRVFGEETHHPRTFEVCWVIAFIYSMVFFLLQFAFTGNATLGGIPMLEPIGALGVRWMAILFLVFIMIEVALLFDKSKFIGKQAQTLTAYIALVGAYVFTCTIVLGIGGAFAVNVAFTFIFAIAFVFAGAFAVTVAVAGATALAFTSAIVFVGTGASFFISSLVLPFTFVGTGVIVGAFAVINTFIGTFANGFAFTGPLAFVVAIVIVFQYIDNWLQGKENYLIRKWLLVIGYVSINVGTLFVTVILLDDLSDVATTHLFFLCALPLINAITDTLSVMASRYCIAKGLAGGRETMFGYLAVDIVTTIIILIFMFALIQLTSWIFAEYFSFTIFREGHNILNVFDNFWSWRSEYLWLKLMAITTVLITLGHLFIVLWHSALFVSPSRENEFENSWKEMEAEEPNKDGGYGMPQAQEKVIHHFTTIRETNTFIHLAIISVVVVVIIKMFIS